MSGIYIPGMEMPTEGTVIAIYKLDGKFYASVHGTELCPLVPVPEHGRLIDADALITKVTDAAIKQPEIADVYYEQASEIGGWLYSMPTIIPADKEGEG